MTPSCGGMVRAVDDDYTTIHVVGSVFTSTTTVSIHQAFTGTDIYMSIQLDEEGRRELIELLGGTP